RAPRREDGGEGPLVEVDDPLDRDPVDLDVLARRHVADAAPVAVGDLGHGLHLLGREHAARDLDALHVARVVELVVEAVGEADRAPLVGGELAAHVALGPARVEREGGAMLCFAGTHRRTNYGRPLAAKSTRPGGRRSSLPAERVVAETRERRAF